MKKLFILFFGLAVVLVGCKKDEKVETTPTPVKSNQVTYNGTSNLLSHGALDYFGKMDSVSTYNFDVILFSSTIVFSDSVGYYEGTGTYVYFELFTNDSTSLPSGTYNFDGTESFATNTFDIADLGLNYNTDTESGTIIEATGGTLTVVKSGSTYELTFSCTSAAGNYSGYYKGALKYFDDSKKKSLKKK